MNREEQVKRLKGEKIWDLVVIGGGATGLGVAVDAASRGYAVALVEKHDFAKGTSSRSTKLIHGGVRYLAQGNLKLVMEALKERGILLRNAPHLTGRQAFIVPVYSWWEMFFYGTGLRLYDLLAGRLQIGNVTLLGRKKVEERMPQVETKKLVGGVAYFDGQFDDARLALALAQTASEQGACIVNHVEVTELLHNEKQVSGLCCRDRLSGEMMEIKAKAVVNATGVFADQVMAMDKAGQHKMLSPSQGVHVVVDRRFFPGTSALMVPKTDDGRVLFAVPWQGKIVIGTTDTGVDEIREEPEAFEEEVAFIIRHFNKYTRAGLRREDVLSVFAGLRPLVRTSNKGSTALVSRDHTIVVSTAGLITIIGGKWTTYRKMAQDVMNNVVFVGKLSRKPCVTDELKLYGWIDPAEGRNDHLAVYGAGAVALTAMVEVDEQMAEPVHPAHPFIKAQVIWAVREEMAMEVEDVLARRIRLLFLDARAAIEAAPLVARWMAGEMGKDEEWITEQVDKFREIASRYLWAD